MWRLKVSEGGGPWLQTVSGFHGRQVWEFDPNAGTDDERAHVERLRREFTENRFRRRESQDLLMRMQLTGLRNLHAGLPTAVKLEDGDEVTQEILQESQRRALGWMSALQAEDGHWPGDYSGIMFLIPFWVFALHITGSIDTVLSKEHIREILRHIYNHQNKDGGWGSNILDESTMFGTCLNYTTLRLLGEEENDGLAKGRAWILSHGTATAAPQWAKILLSEYGIAHARVEDSKVTSAEVKQPGRVSGYPRYTPTQALLSHSPGLRLAHARVEDCRGYWGLPRAFSRSYPAVSTKEAFGQCAEGLPPSHKKQLLSYDKSSVIGVYDWSGNDPVIPELWLVPRFLPIHPGRFWCFTRISYMSLAFLYGKRFVGPVTPNILALRNELYSSPYGEIDWNKARNTCAKEDMRFRPSAVYKAISNCLYTFVEPMLNIWPMKKVRERALRHILEHIHYEDETTQYIGLCPITKALNMICCWVENPSSDVLKRHLPRIHDYLWIAEDGMKAKVNFVCSCYPYLFLYLQSYAYSCISRLT
ncbi:hypothetical protein U9M48_001100 [Paspalum notatum var. saurae]|uniref:Squalene cyclase N-terminal domain-containing protein n=1 Tax=Paspalum notatum var. saurae TaxID=547442 RepID=A0AAQ3SEY4_PASNO